MTETFAYEGQPLTEKRAEQIAAEALADLDAMSDGEVDRRSRPPGRVAKRIGRPRVAGTDGTGPSAQVRVRVSGELLDRLEDQAARSHRSRSDIIREALQARAPADGQAGLQQLASDVPDAGSLQGCACAGRDRQVGFRTHVCKRRLAQQAVQRTAVRKVSAALDKQRADPRMQSACQLLGGTAFVRASEWLRRSGARIAFEEIVEDTEHAPARRLCARASFTVLSLVRRLKAL